MIFVLLHSSSVTLFQVIRDQPFFGEFLPVRWLRCLDAVFAHVDAVITMERFASQVNS